MSKPILVIKFPNFAEFEQLQSAEKLIDKRGIRNDYHVFIIKDLIETVSFECFNAPHTEIEFKELQERILTLLKNK